MVSGPPRCTKRNGAQKARRSTFSTAILSPFLTETSLALPMLFEMSPIAKIAAWSASKYADHNGGDYLDFLCSFSQWSSENEKCLQQKTQYDEALEIPYNAYKIELPGHYNVSATFNFADLSPYEASSNDDMDSETNPFEAGEDDAQPGTHISNLSGYIKF
nr:reverse transcriptase domain-containing protein [Tanacetum cinerariifolium]